MSDTDNTAKLAVDAFNAITEEAYYGFNLQIVMAGHPRLAEAVLLLAQTAKQRRQRLAVINARQR